MDRNKLKHRSRSKLGLTILLYIVSLSTCTNGQSTTAAPQGNCANYLNRYTKEGQCVYSFIVPKKDQDSCPGLESQVQQLQQDLTRLLERQSMTEDQIQMLLKSDRNSQLLGQKEERVASLELERNRLQAENNRLQEEKTQAVFELTTKTVDLGNAQEQLIEAERALSLVNTNHTQLISDFQVLRRQQIDIQQKYDAVRRENEELSKSKNCSDINKHLPSCAIIKQWGYTKSGYAMIDPDGEDGVEPFMVYCDMDTDPSTGITVINHNLVRDTVVSGCDTPGCLALPVEYEGASIAQITKLVDISLACEQFIRYDCYDSKLLKDDTAWWESRDGSHMTYWGGAPPNSNMCQCGVTNSCTEPNTKCHCDADRERWLYDEGYLKEKDSLPVTKLRFGDVKIEAGEQGKSTLGPLRCKWNVNSSVSSCEALLQAGVRKPGVYLIDPDGQQGPIDPISTHCNFDGSYISSNVSQRPVIKVQNPNQYIFSDCGQKPGMRGPTQDMCNQTYTGGNVHVRVNEGMQFWRVPKNGRYMIKAEAPSGYHVIPSKAGRGAILTAEFKLRGGTQLRVLVGQKGTDQGGSGGTFVIRMFETYTHQPLLIAGAGGSTSIKQTSSNYEVTHASETQNGKDGSSYGTNFGQGGEDGNGGDRGVRLSGSNTPGGGAGFKTNGQKSSDVRFSVPPTSAIAIKGEGKGSEAPGLGGSYTYIAPGQRIKHEGGFGGGGSSAKYAPGGAGGYSGGGGGPDQGYSGGGGSFVRGSEASKYNIETNNVGAGRVTIEYLGPAAELDREDRENAK